MSVTLFIGSFGFPIELPIAFPQEHIHMAHVIDLHAKKKIKKEGMGSLKITIIGYLLE
jgi:hypothetical protein